MDARAQTKSGGNHVKARIMNPSGNNTDAYLTDKGDGTYRVEYTAYEEGKRRTQDRTGVSANLAANERIKFEGRQSCALMIYLPCSFRRIRQTHDRECWKEMCEKRMRLRDVREMTVSRCCVLPVLCGKEGERGTNTE